MHTDINKKLTDENIQLNYSKLNNQILGCYYSIDDLNLIIINESIKSNYKQLNCVIAEELGHYFTTCGNYAPYSCNESNDTINHSRIELRALKWAVNFLVPTEELLKYISENSEINIDDLSNNFEVTDDFIMRKFYYLSLVKSRYQLTMDRYLILSSYPSIFIYSNYERSNNYGIDSKTC